MKLKISRDLAAQGLVEYALILVLIAVASLSILQISGVSTYNVYCRVASVFSSNACQTSTVYCNDGFNSLSGWQVTAAAELPAAGPAQAPPPSSGEPNDVLRKLMQQREQELK